MPLVHPAPSLSVADATALREILIRSGYLLVHEWQESHGNGYNLIFQRPARMTNRDGLATCQDEITLMSPRPFNHDTTWNHRVDAKPRHDRILALSIEKDMAENPEDWSEADETISPCCTAGYRHLINQSGRRYILSRVAGHGSWADEDR